MEKILFALLGIAYICSIVHSQDIGGMRRMMLMRQRELALRRAVFPFGMRGIRGAGIPPPVAARLALLERQRAIGSRFFGTPFSPVGPLLSPFASRAIFGRGSPFGSTFTLTGPTDTGRFDLSTVGFPGGATDGLTPVSGGSRPPTAVINGPTGLNGQQGGSGNIFGQPSQAAEYIETNRRSVDLARSMVDQPPRPGFHSPDNVGSTGSRSRMSVQRIQRPPDIGRPTPQQLPSDMFTERLPPPRPQPLRAQTRFPPRPSTIVHQVRRPGPQQLPSDVFTQRLLPLPPQPLRVQTRLPSRPPPPLPLPLPRRAPPPPGSRPYLPLAEPRMIPPRPPLLRRPSERRGQRQGQRERRRLQGRRSRGQIVFPNVPEIVQIPAVASATHGQSTNGQQSATGLIQTGASPLGGQTDGQMDLQFGRPFGGQMGGQLVGPMSGQFGGPPFSGQPSAGQFPSGSAIFPSQTAQGPIIRQRGPSFTAGRSFSGAPAVPMMSGFPNGPTFAFPDGTRNFGQSDFFRRPISTGNFHTSGFPRFPGVNFRQGVAGPSIGGMAEGRIIPTRFGFVGPSGGAAGPAFATGTQPSNSENFNIQFHPLQPNQQIPQIPEQQTNPNQLGLGPNILTNNMNNGFQSGIFGQGGVQFGTSGQSVFQPNRSGQDGFQFGGSNQTGFQNSGGAHAANQFRGFTDFVETTSNQQDAGIGTGSISPGLSGQGWNNGATNIPERPVEMNPTDVNTGFRLVKVGNILGDDGFLNTGASSGSVATINTVSDQQEPSFQPFGSFETVNGSPNIVELSLGPETMVATDLSVSTPDAASIATETDITVAGRDATASIATETDITVAGRDATATSASGSSTTHSLQDGPFAASLNKDFSFFMADNSNQPPNEMPPIIFNAPEPPPFTGPQGITTLTFPVQGTGSAGSDTTNTSQSGFSFSNSSVTTIEGNNITQSVQPDATIAGAETTLADANTG